MPRRTRSASPGSLTPDRLRNTLRNTVSLPVNSEVYVAFSGGVDSHVLLHALAQIRQDYPFSLHAVHINHGLHDDADSWTEHCQRVCDSLGVELNAKTVDVTPAKGESLEAAARDARYRAIAGILPADAVCMTAQHRSDQTETLLLQLLRGAGVHGLAAMPAARPFARGLLIRPLLEYSQDAILQYARDNHLDWVDDPSNLDPGFDRNYLRNQVIPHIRKRWPGMDRSIARSVRHAASARTLLDEIALSDLEACGAMECHEHPPAIACLRIDVLSMLSTQHIQNALRHWVRLHGLPVPGDDRLATLLNLLHESPAKGEIDWSQSSFRLADSLLWLCHRRPCKADMRCDYSWHPSVPLRLKETASELRAQTCKGEGLSTIKLGNRALRVTCRNGGELCRMPGNHGMKSLKKLFQDLSIPAWRRSCIPLVYLDDELLAIGAYWYNPHFLPAASEDGYIFSFDRCHLQGSDC